MYDALGTPSNESYFFYKRGNFMPYNSISASHVSTNTNLYDESGNELSNTDPARGKTLYKTQGENDYYFGMYVEADFIQPSNGKLTKGSDMVYEFNGDDDLWVYVDGVLMLDIGGIHDAHSGSINFATGAITYDSVSGTTIKEQFHAAGVFPDGSAWDDSRVSEFFNDNTLKDFTSHNFKMFYMERGAWASNLKMKFNLEVVPQGTVEVEKQLTNTDKEKYSDVEFGFRVWAQEIVNTDSSGNETYSEKYVPLTEATYSKGEKTGQEIGASFVVYDDKKEDNVFKLKPDEAIRFSNLKILSYRFWFGNKVPPLLPSIKFLLMTWNIAMKMVKQLTGQQAVLQLLQDHMSFAKIIVQLLTAENCRLQSKWQAVSRQRIPSPSRFSCRMLISN